MRFFRFAYMVNSSNEERLRPHELRDGDAFAELATALHELGHEYRGLFINYGDEKTDRSLDLLNHMGSDDFLVLTTRPPLNDDRKDPKHVSPSYTQFEQKVVFPAIREYVILCKRSQVQLSPECAKHLKPEFGNRANLHFYTRKDTRKNRFEAAYDSQGRRNDAFAATTPDRTTAAYLLHTGPVYYQNRVGPQLLIAFGVSGTIGLVFAHQLRTQKQPVFQGLLESTLAKPSMHVVEITVEPDIPSHLDDLSFSDAWKYQLLSTEEYLAAQSKPPGKTHSKTRAAVSTDPHRR